MMFRYYPNELRGVVDDKTFRVLKDIYDKLYDLDSRLDKVETGAQAGQLPLNFISGLGITVVANNNLARKQRDVTISILPPSQSWAAWTGTLNRATKNSGTATLADVAQTVAALINDLLTQGELHS